MPKRNSLSVGIVGAGTAGLAAAIALARAGHRVTVFEKHAAMAPLGAGVLIQPQGVAALDKLGVGKVFHGASVPVTGLLGTCHRDWKLVDIRYDSTPARGVSRQVLSQVLLDAALPLGVRLRFGNPVDRIQSNGTTASVHVGSMVCAFDLVVMADGAGSTLPAQAGLAMASNMYEWGALWAMFDVANWPNEALLEQRYHGTSKMFGLMPTAWVDGKLRLSMFWSLPCRDHAEWRVRPLEDWKTELLALWPGSAPVVNQIVSHDQFALATYRHARARRLANGPICVIGDAAHSMSPQLGLGTTLAVQDALALANAVGEFGAIAGAAMYSSRRLGVVRKYQWLSRALTPCFQARGGGLWGDLLFAAGVNIPGIKTLMYRSIAAPASGNRQTSSGTVDRLRID